MLGSELAATLAGEHELWAVDIRKPLETVPGVQYQLLDIVNTKETFSAITRINPELVIHTAAFTDVDGAETKSDLVFQVNAIGTRNVALSCQKFDAALIYISTDYVFDGQKTEPYVEFDQPHPLSIYAQSKYWGELYTQWLVNRFMIIRTSWMFGKNGRNFVQAMLSQLKNQHSLKVVKDQVGSPTYAVDLALAIKELITVNQQVSTGLYGIWHLTNSGFCSWYEFAAEIVRLSQSHETVESTTSEQLQRPAVRPKNSVLRNYNWELQNFAALPPWQDALRRYLVTIK